jgi:hypothetical protein
MILFFLQVVCIILSQLTKKHVILIINYKNNKMKKIIVFVFLAVGFSMNAQTSKELLGKWQLVKWVQNGKEKDINAYFKTDQVFQVFLDGGHFESVNGDEVHKAKWKLSKDNSELTITSAIIPVKFHIDSFDAQKRVMTYEQLGTFEYKKVAN